MSDQGPSLETIKQAMRATWMAGDFGVVAKSNEFAGELFAESLHLHAGTHVLDVATGTGNVAIPLAKMGCVVTGVDIAPNLIAQARERAVHAHVSVTFDEGDAEALPYDDGEFDAVVSMFGAMFAPRPELVVSEAARVLKPGGLLAMANWNPASFTGRMFRAGVAHVPPPPGVKPPVLWGDEATVRERLGAHFDHVEAHLVPLMFDLPTSPEGAVEFFKKYFGPTKMAFEKLDEAGQAAMHADLVKLWTEANTSDDPERVLIPNEYLKVTARKR